MMFKYFAPFKAEETADLNLALREGILPIEGEAIDTSVNKNKWQVPEEDLEFLTSSLTGAQLRIDHAESVLSIVGKVNASSKLGDKVFFKAEVGEPSLFPKILRDYVNTVSIQVDSDNVECSVCHKQTRKDGMLVHLCPAAWEIVHKPRVRELSIVATPAYEKTLFRPVGFAAAVNRAFYETPRENLLAAYNRLLAAFSQLPKGNGSKDGGSKGDLQEPDKKAGNSKKEDPAMSVKDQNVQAAGAGASQDNSKGSFVASKKAGDLSYEELENQLIALKKQIESAGDVEMDNLKEKIAELDSEVAKRATKKALTQKLNQLTESLKNAAATESASKNASQDAQVGKSASDKKPTGQGLVAVQEPTGQGVEQPWFKDLLKANTKLKGMQ